MKELYSSLTSKGQVTVPKEIRLLLGLQPRDKLVFVVEDGGVRLERGGSIVARTAGALRSSRPAPSAEELRAVAERAIAEEAQHRAEG